MLELCSLSTEDTLSKWLKSNFHFSQNQLKKYLSKKQLALRVDLKKELKLPIDLLNHLQINPNYHGPPIKLLIEDSDFLVLSKPSRIHCHPLKYNDSDNVLSFLRANGYHRYLSINQESYDRSLIYRLDYETSGLLVLANNLELYQSVRSKFHEQVKTKIYLAICHGNIKTEGQQKQFFKDFGPKGQSQKVFSDQVDGSTVGDMSIKKIMYNKDFEYSLVQVQLKTGLRHQIRAGLAFLGHPIVGDTLYGGNLADRLFLHAYEYSIEVGSNNKVYKDSSLELFNKFFDLNSLL